MRSMLTAAAAREGQILLCCGKVSSSSLSLKCTAVLWGLLLGCSS